MKWVLNIARVYKRRHRGCAL